MLQLSQLTLEHAQLNIVATVGADGSNNAGKIVLAHNTDAAAAIGEHSSLATVFTAYDTENSAAAATIAVKLARGHS